MAEDLIGRTLLDGEYRLTGVLGRGGMATVYRAYSRSLETDVAVKVLAPRLAADPGFRERHHDEARSLAQLHHPNLVEVHHYGEEGDLVYIVMRLVPGGTLKNRLEALGGPLGLLSTARLISQVADALQLAHSRGLVHLDIKPANILLGRSDWPLLADFGITRAVKNLQSAHGHERMAGTPLYMSPEQCQGDAVDGRSDQYSLAITTFELLTGRRPFQAETTEAVLQHQIEDPPPRPREVNPGIPGPVEDVLLRALSKAPADRFPTIRDFAEALTDAAERTRGVSLETKSAVAGAAPNLLGVLALLLLGPLLFGILPGSALVGSRMPLAWPFKLVLSVLIAGLLVGIRWHLIGLLTRGLDSLLDAVLSLGGGVPALGALAPGSLKVKSWRNAALGSVEGAVNLIYLLVIYRLIATPVLAMASALVDSSVQVVLATVVNLIVVLLALGIVVAMYRGGGAVVAGITLGVTWAFASALPSADVAAAGGFSFAWTIRAVVGAGVLAILLASRGRTQGFIRHLAMASIGRMVAEVRPGAPSEEVVAAREQLARVVGGSFDFFYLLVGYALLRTPLTEGLQRLLGLLPAAIVVSGIAALFWLLLTLRLRAAAGGSGLALGLLLGAPLLLSLPFLQASVIGSAWPATVATWVVGTVLILVLVAIRGRVQGMGRQALSPMMDRGLLGAQTARTEEHSDRRLSAFGGVVGALLDVGYLVLAYWILGGPAAEAIGKATGRTGVGSVLLVALVLGSIVLLLGPVHHSLATVEETGGPRWSSRFQVVPALAVALVALLIGGCAAAPMALAAPDVAGGFAMTAPSASTVVVDWEHWLPWTPTHEEATYDLSLSCSDGRSFGQFREVFHPATGGAMPSGNVGRLGSTNSPCDNWTAAYFAQRQAAGLPARPSESLDWLDVQTTIHPDGSADIVETHRELFTFGQFTSLSWSLPSSPDSGEVSDLQILENGTPYPMSPARSGGRSVQASAENGKFTARWTFPTVNSPDERIFTIKYHLKNAVRAVGSGMRFERLILPASRPGPAWRTTVEVTLPGSFGAASVHLGANGAPSQFGMVDGRTASFTAQNVPTGTGMTVYIDFRALPGPAVPPANPTSTPTLTATPTLVPEETAMGGLVPALAEQSATATSETTDTPTPIATVMITPSITPTATQSATTTASPTVGASATVTNTPRPVPTATATTAPAAKSCANVPVLAMYYDWYDMKTWTSGTTSDQPVAPYVSADRATIERQVTEAQGAGIEGFEVNWWGPGNQTDTNLQTLLSVAGSHGFKVTIDFDLNSPFVHNAGDVTNDLLYAKRYFNDPSWFKYNGKPYFVFYGTRKYDVSTWGAILQQADPNHSALWIAEGDIFSYLDVFDGIHPYSVAWSPNPSRQLASYASQTRAHQGKIWMATTMPGYNDKLARGAQGFSVDRQGGAYYTTMWQGAVASHPDVISITSFNEWVEGSQMEPSKSYGNLYLDLTRQMVAKYQAQLKPCG